MSSSRGEMRYAAMDGVRGVAALCVAVYHVSFAHGDWLPGAFVAVDVFFCLSGFVLSGAHEPQLEAGLGALAFLKIRIARLFPMYALGFAVGLLAHYLTLSLGAPVTAGWPAIWMAVNGLLFLPSLIPNQLGFGTYSTINCPYPYNPPSWSLFFELLANAAFAIFRPRGWRLAVVLFVFGFALVGATMAIGYPAGWGSVSFWGGAPRALFEFYLGYGVRRLADRGVLPLWQVPLLGPAAVLFAACAPFGAGNLAYFFFAVIVAPAILVVSLRSPRSPALLRIYQELGRLSYPLYVLHVPAFKIFIIVNVAWIARDSNYSPGPAALLTFVAAVALASWLVAVFVEPPLRRALARRLAAGARGNSTKVLSIRAGWSR